MTITEWGVAAGVVLIAVAVVLLIGAGVGWFLLIVAFLSAVILGCEFLTTASQRRQDAQRLRRDRWDA